MSFPFTLPAALEPFRDRLLQTKRSFIRVKSAPAKNMQAWESKVGGMPYMPKSMEWPCTPDGKPLFFLAQIRFSEIPALDPFPREGILQFFINDDDLYGMDFDEGERQDTFRVIYHPKVSESPADIQLKFPPMRDYDELPHHPDESYPLVFSIEEEIASVTDYQFDLLMGADFFRQFGEAEWDIIEEFERSNRPQGHKIGGYAYFTQDDPRRPEDPMLLLFQIDSDERMDLMWGDMGVGHFFIREKDLRAADFSRVLYDWDCL